MSMSAVSRRGALALGGGLLAIPGLRAQGLWNPTRPITLVVGYPAGGQTDFVARAILQGLQRALGTSIIIDHRPGAGGNLGTEMVMGARPDGYTLLAANVASMTINPHTMDQLTIDPREMIPIGLAQQSSMVLCTHPSIQVQDLAGLRGWMARQAPGAISFASTGAGSLRHVAMELFRERLNLPAMSHVTYRGTASAMQDLLAGRCHLMFDSASIVTPLLQGPPLQAPRLRGILVTGRSRCPALPEIATAGQQGLGNFIFTNWTGLFAPGGTPPEISGRLNVALNAVLAEPATRERLLLRGHEPGGGTPATMGEMMAQCYARWGAVVRANNIRAEG